ncbi:LuxR C-terminal-related transcriptional regulator [Streptomyces sp. NPDC006197]|uniref:ATP-binding protein n=1 Tax=Streptomyces sp. NPDC006197 TaxID=3156685 RepID=UPI0033BDAE8C
MVTLPARLPNAVPADLTSFVGRRQDIAAVRQLLAAARLVTLTGIGGVGKTRLAWRVATELRRAFPDGVCLVELASLRDPALLPTTLIDALAIPESSARPSMDTVCDHLRERRMLLLLDNCEHLVEATADLAYQVLRAAPDVRIVATSRQALRIAGEHVYPVPPLPAPDPEDPPEPGTATRYPSVALFAERSAAVVPGFEVTPDNEAAVIRLCHRLEGIPLAIELASVRLRVLTVDELASRLDDRFQLLREGNRNLPERHQTLQALIDWSYNLCSPMEQALWARASVFAGGFGVDGLEAVCTDVALPAHEVLDTVAGLVDKSIFIREEQGKYVRFRMLETIHAYGRARLAESGDEPVLIRRHRDWCLRLVETADDEWGGDRQQEWASRLELEHANLRHALDYCLSQPGEARVALHMAAVPWLWIAMGCLTEGKLWLDRALALDQEPSRERAWALSTAAYITMAQGDEPAATALAEEARDVAFRLHDLAALAYATHVRALCHSLRADLAGSDLSGAVPLFVEALQQYADADVPAAYPNFLRIELASVHILLGEADKAAEVVDDLFEWCQTVGDRWQLSYALWERGFVRLIRGEGDRAEADLCEALRIKRFFHDTLGLALVLEVLAWTAVAKGDAERAATLLGGTTALWQTIGAQLFGSTHMIAQRERFEKAAREKIGNAAFDAAFGRGSALTAEETLALALRERVQPAPETQPAAPALTRRERQVADLIAEGMSNKEIAAALIISPRTAEGHVEKILTKLGFATRTQIASWVVQQQAGRT